ncbi:NAD(P)/FAD-dependent oxidoreductase [Streptomyces sp. NPDC050698]
MGDVLVIGGSVAGTATALALHKAGFAVTLHEAHPDAAEDIGAFLTLASNGMRALAQLDAAAAVTALGFPLTGMRMLDGSGTQRAARPLGEARDPLLRYRCLRRGELNVALQTEAARRGIPIRHSARLVSVEDGPDSVTAHFADGGTATGDLLVGADGLHSTVRRSIAPTVRPVHAGEQVFYGRTADAPGTAPTDLITFVRGASVAFGFTVSPEGETYWFARVAAGPRPSRRTAHDTPARMRDRLVTLLREDATPAAGIVEATADDLLVTDAMELPKGMPWRSARCLLVGDAAHAASPATGQGASMALEDAVVLAKSLRDAPDPGTALTTYESLRRPRVEHNITVSGDISRRTGTRPAAPAPRPGDEDLIRRLEWDGR